MDVYAKPNLQEFIGSIDGDNESGYTVKVFGDSGALAGVGFQSEDDAFAALLEESGHAQGYKGIIGPLAIGP